jgi:hypothetical protein
MITTPILPPRNQKDVTVIVLLCVEMERWGGPDRIATGDCRSTRNGTNKPSDNAGFGFWVLGFVIWMMDDG